MLQTMRDNAQGMIAKIIVGFIIVVFALWGVESIVNIGSGSSATIEVNGQGITEVDIARAVEQQKANLRRQFGEQYDESLFNEQFLRQSAIEQLIEQKIALVQAQELGLRAAPRSIDESIVTIPAFQLDGRFNKEQFQNVLRLNGLSPMMFRDGIAEEIITSQVRAAFVLSSLETPFAAAFAAALDQEQRTFRFHEVNVRNLEAAVVLTEDEIEQAYQASQERYRTEEQVSVRYVRLQRAELANSQSVSEDELAQAYADYQARESVREQRQARHILLEVNDDRTLAQAFEQATALKQRLAAGEDFAALAREYSDDIGTRAAGGQLGLSPRGGYVDAFDEALFALAEGAVSEPVETEYGVHLIRADKVVKAKVQSLDAMRDQLAQEIRTAKADAQFAEQLQELSNIAFSAESLADVASAMGLTVNETGLFTREAGEGIALNAGVRQAAFSDEVLLDKEISPVVELEDSALVLAVATHQESIIQPLADVRGQVVAGLTREKAQALAKERADAVAAGDEQVSWKAVTTQFAQTSEAPRAAQQRAFAMLKDESAVIATPGGYTVVVVDAIDAADWQATTATPELVEAGRAQNSRTDLFSYNAWARSVSSVER